MTKCSSSSTGLPYSFQAGCLGRCRSNADPPSRQGTQDCFQEEEEGRWWSCIPRAGRELESKKCEIAGQEDSPRRCSRGRRGNMGRLTINSPSFWLDTGISRCYLKKAGKVESSEWNNMKALAWNISNLLCRAVRILRYYVQLKFLFWK